MHRALAAVILAAGFMSQAAVALPKSYVLSAESGEGLVVVGVEDIPPFNTVEIRLARINPETLETLDEKMIKASVGHILPLDLKLFKTGFDVVRAKAGRYVIAYSVVHDGNVHTTSYHCRGTFAFDVVPGFAVYIGNYRRLSRNIERAPDDAVGAVASVASYPSVVGKLAPANVTPTHYFNPYFRDSRKEYVCRAAPVAAPPRGKSIDDMVRSINRLNADLDLGTSFKPAQ